MGQKEVYEFLKTNKKKWFTAREIADKIKSSTGSVTVSVAKLKRIGFIKSKKVEGEKATRYTFVK